jgi:glycosyltransferase involved in cell wall biosynthesis
MPDAGLGCAVLSVGSPATLVGAVRSLLEQEPMPEVVVVNSGGGDASAMLRQAGLDVPVVECSDRLLPGGARNRGIAALRSQYVAFLAEDCRAEVGWVAGRLGAHTAGAPTVASVMTNATPGSRSACAAYLLLHHRRMPDTPAGDRLLYGISYDRAVFDRVGCFREDLRAGEDTELAARLGDGLQPILAPEVRTAHLNSTSPGEFVHDQWVRGARAAHVRRRLVGLRRVRWALAHALLNVPAAMAQTLRTRDRDERRRLLAAWPLLPLGSLAYTAGAIKGLLDGRPRTRGPAVPGATASPVRR